MYNHLIYRAMKIIARKKSLGEGVDFEDAHQPTLGDDGAESIERAMQVARLVKAMQELEVDDPRAARIIKLKNGGLTNEEIVEAAGVDVSAVKRDWRAAGLSRLSSGIETGLIVRAATVPRIFSLINGPFSSSRAPLLMKCGEAADVYRPLRAVAQH
jgi:hypothetical protein